MTQPGVRNIVTAQWKKTLHVTTRPPKPPQRTCPTWSPVLLLALAGLPEWWSKPRNMACFVFSGVRKRKHLVSVFVRFFSSFLAFGTNVRLFSWCLWLQGKGLYLQIIKCQYIKLTSCLILLITDNIDFYGVNSAVKKKIKILSKCKLFNNVTLKFPGVTFLIPRRNIEGEWQIFFFLLSFF